MASISSIMHVQPFSNPHPTHLRHHLQPPKSLKFHSYKKSNPTNRANRLPVPRGTRTTSGEGDHDPRAPDTIGGLYNTIMNRSLDELSGSTGDGRHLWKTLTIMILFKGKKMFYSLMEFLVSHIEFVIKPTTRGEGADIGIKWYFEWKDTPMPLGQDCGLYTSHVYYGKLFLRNGKQLIEPMLHMEPLRSKLEQIAMLIVEKIAVHSALKGKRKAAFLYCLLSLVVMAVSLLLLNNPFG